MSTQTTTPTTRAHMISAQTISTQMISNRVEVAAGDIDATIAILDAVASFCSEDRAARRLARRINPTVTPPEIANLADALTVMFSQRVTTTTSTTEAGR